MSDFEDGIFNFIDTLGDDSGGMGGINWGALATTPGSSYGMNDRGLGTSGGGTLSADQISGLGAGGGLNLSQIMKGLGIAGKDGNLDLTSLLSVLAPLLGGAYASNQTGRASDQQVSAINSASQGLANVGNQNTSLYAPYRDAGAGALTKLQTMPQSNIGSRFQALGSGRGFSLGDMMRGR